MGNSTTAHLVFDDEGGTWHCRVGSDPLDREEDTVPLKQLREGAEAPAAAEVPPGVDPYRTDSTPASPAARRPPRRTLDDMRELSEQIKTARDLKKDAK